MSALAPAAASNMRGKPARNAPGKAGVGFGIAALAAIALLIGGALAGLAVEASRDPSGAKGAFDAYLLRIAWFTLWQAGLSTLLSVLPALFVARALARHPQFFGRGLVLRLFALPLALPAIVAALGLLSLFGRAGYLADLVATAGGGQWPGIYGLSGILIAHVFFNMPLATRLLLGALQTVPDDQWRLASQLGMGARSSFRLIEWPVLRAAIPGAAGLVFMLCVTSFTLVLTLGGGPGATTLEVAIYQALRFDFDPARAVMLTLAQVLLTAVVTVLLIRLGADAAEDTGLGVSRRRYISTSRTERLVNAALIVMALVYVAGPMISVVTAGLSADLGRLAGEQTVRRAAVTSLVLALLAALLSCALAYCLTAMRRTLSQRRGKARHPALQALAGSASSLVLVVPPIVVGAGWFVLMRTMTDVFALAPAMVISVNAVMAMPFALRLLRPAYDAASARNERLAASLGIAGWTRLRLIDWPLMRRPLSTAFAFSMALSLGDLGVIALFGSEQVQTLPYLLLSRMGSYRTEDAAGLALLLGLLCLALMALADRGAGEKR